MTSMFLSWSISAVVIVISAIALGRILESGWTGILIDTRGRYSLVQFQLVLWTVVVLSLISGLFFARLTSGIGDALQFTVPNELLIVMGISLGGTVGAIAIKAGKDERNAARIAASSKVVLATGFPADRPRFAQVFLIEEGELADKIVDVTKFQNFWLTLILVVAYVVLTINNINTASTIGDVVLPGFTGTFLTLLGISHAAYLAGKLPDQPGSATGLTVELRRQALLAAAPAAVATGVARYAPRNP